MSALIIPSCLGGAIFASPAGNSHGLAYAPHTLPMSRITRVVGKMIPKLADLDSKKRVRLMSGTKINIGDIEDIIPDKSGGTLHGEPYLWIKLSLRNLRRRGVIASRTHVYHLRKIVTVGYFPLVRTIPDTDLTRLRRKFKNLPRAKDSWPNYTHPNA